MHHARQSIYTPATSGLEALLLFFCFVYLLICKNLPAVQETRFFPWVGKIPWRRKWQPTPAFLPGKPIDSRAWQTTVHGVTKKSDMIQQLNSNTINSVYMSNRISQVIPPAPPFCHWGTFICSLHLCFLPFASKNIFIFLNLCIH